MWICPLFSLLYLLLFSRADAIFGYGLMRCQFTSPDDVVYLAQIYFNKEFVGEYNSTSGNYTGYTEDAKKVADAFNNDPEMKRQEKKNEEQCREKAAMASSMQTSVEPSVRLKAAAAASSQHPGLLICSAYGFYPKQINVTWLRDGEEVTADVTSTEELPNGNWYHQIHSYLEYTPRSGEKITCVVEHASFTEPKHYEWDPTDESQRNKIAVGVAGLLLGLVCLSTGLIYYLKKTTGHELVPTSSELQTT